MMSVNTVPRMRWTLNSLNSVGFYVNIVMKDIKHSFFFLSLFFAMAACVKTWLLQAVCHLFERLCVPGLVDIENVFLQLQAFSEVLLGGPKHERQSSLNFSALF